MNINFLSKSSIQFSLEIVEIDEIVPSYKIECKVFGEELKIKCKIEFSFWILKSGWGAFENDLKIVDLDEITRLSVYTFEKTNFIEINAFQKVLSTNFNFKVKTIICNEEIELLKQKFRESI
jgi:hypothetical protein